MQIYEREGRWYIYFRHNGRRYRESAGPEATKDIAGKLLKKRIRELTERDKIGARVQSVTFADFADEWLQKDSPLKKSKDRDEDIAEMLKVAWNGRNLDGINTEMIEDYKALRLKKAKRAPATVNKEIQVIKRLFKKAHAWGRITANPAANVEKLKANNTRIRFLEPKEIKRLEAKLPEWLRPIVTFARFTGARRGEILNLTWNDCDTKRETITFRDTKNGETGTIEMNETVKALLRSLPEPISRAQAVFPPMKIEKLRKAWLTACRKAKIEDFHFHDLRHQAATDLLTLGATLNDVRDFLRHKSIAMTLRYGHLVKDRRSRTARLLDRLSPKTATVRSSVPLSPVSPSSSLAQDTALSRR